MLRTVFWYTFAWSHMVVTWPLLLIAAFLERKGRLIEKDAFVHRFVRYTCRYLIRLTGSSVELKGHESIPHGKPVLFVSNHQGHMDSIILGAHIDIPIGFVSIVEVLDIPILRTWMKHMRCVFLDRKDMRQTLKTMEHCVETLKNGHSMVIYPEGKLSDCDVMNEFKKGCLKLAMKAQVPIVPVAINGSYNMMSKSGKKIDAASVKCTIAQPVMPDTESEKDLMEKVRVSIAESL